MSSDTLLVEAIKAGHGKVEPQNYIYQVYHQGKSNRLKCFYPESFHFLTIGKEKKNKYITILKIRNSMDLPNLIFWFL